MEFLSRRRFLQDSACGFGSLAFAGLGASKIFANDDPLAAKKPHHRPRAKRVIFLFMQAASATSTPTITSRSSTSRTAR